MVSSKSATTLKLFWTLLLVYSVSTVLAVEHLIAMKGSQVLLKCMGKKPLNWRNENGEVIGRQKGRFQQNVVGDLKIASLRLSDRGRYTCSSLDSSVIYKQIDLEIPAAPTLVNITSIVNVKKNEVAIINCMAEGHPEPAIKWYRYKSGEKHSIANGTTLHARMPCEYCKEQFLCKAENKFGTESVNITVNVVGTPEVKAIEKSVDAAIGQNVTIQCTVRSNPPILFFKWLKHGELIQNSIRRKINFKMRNEFEFDCMLSIEKLKEKDFGDYEFLVRNELGNETQSIQITLDPKKSHRTPKKKPRVSPLSASTDLVICSHELMKETTKSKASKEETATQSLELVSSNMGSVCKNSWKQFTAMIILPFFMYTSFFLS